MKHEPPSGTDWTPASGLPGPLDCETLALLRRFIAPILETAQSWSELDDRLGAKGYGLGFRAGHLVILNDNGSPVCTGRALGVPLRAIARRIGRPVIKVGRDGRSGHLA